MEWVTSSLEGQLEAPPSELRRLIQCLLPLLPLLVDEFSTDLMLVGQVSDGFGSGEQLNGDVLATIRG